MTNAPKMWNRHTPELYYFADSLPLCQKLLEGGATIIQLRAKNISDREFLNLARDMQQQIRDFPGSQQLIINDRVDIAFDLKADGVHIGQNDQDFRKVIDQAPEDMTVGVSVNTVQQAVDAEKAGADYVGAGSVFSTPTKNDAIVIGLDELHRIANAIAIPVVAIGGITLENVQQVQDHGAHYFAVISAINNAPDISRQIAAFNKIIQAK